MVWITSNAIEHALQKKRKKGKGKSSSFLASQLQTTRNNWLNMRGVQFTFFANIVIRSFQSRYRRNQQKVLNKHDTGLGKIWIYFSSHFSTRTHVPQLNRPDACKIQTLEYFLESGLHLTKNAAITLYLTTLVKVATGLNNFASPFKIIC